jgi:hypothetical protein
LPARRQRSDGGQCSGQAARGGELFTHPFQPRRGGRDARGPHPPRERLVGRSPTTRANNRRRCPQPARPSYSCSPPLILVLVLEPLTPRSHPLLPTHARRARRPRSQAARTTAGVARSAGVDRRHLACPASAVRWRSAFRPGRARW